MWIGNLFKIIKFNGGLRKSILTFWRTDELKFGKFVGKDSFGNRYFENDYYFFGRNRWVIYSNRFGYDYDGSQVHYKWFRWLHYMTDIKPDDEERPNYPWMLEHTENMTGTKYEYVPYSTTTPKIIPWVPKKPTCSRRRKKENVEKEQKLKQI